MRAKNWRLAPYNGHSNWYTWNVSLWLGNDEGNYRAAQEKLRDLSHKFPTNKTHVLFGMTCYLRGLFRYGTPDSDYVKRAAYRQIAKDFIEAELS